MAKRKNNINMVTIHDFCLGDKNKSFYLLLNKSAHNNEILQLSPI